MLLKPRYGEPPVLRFAGAVVDPGVPLLRQRRRLAAALAGLSDEQWAAPSRCSAWSVKDVITHLVSTNQFWAMSITAGLAGSPTQFLASFDPVASPPQMVDALRALTPAEVLEQFAETTESIADSIDGLDDDGWSTPAEAPPGHIAIHLVALHALWDSWIHERDVLLPLGIAPVVEADEVVGCLRYVAAIGPAFLAATGSERSGTLEVDATEPDVHFVVEAGDSVVMHDGTAANPTARLTGRAVDLVDALSFRAPLDHSIAEGDRWILGGLAEVFDTTVDAPDRS